MEARRFDALARALSSRFTRRQAVTAGAASAASAGLAAVGLARAQQPPVDPVVPGDPAAADRTFFLFVQTFSAGTMTVHPDDPNRHLLTLTGHAAETVYFSDRPERIVGSLPTTRFLEGLGFPDDNPPNAALVAGEQVIVVEIFNPVYSETFGDEGTVTLTYDVAVLADYAEEGLAHLARQADATPPEAFASASLFIDDCPYTEAVCWGRPVERGQVADLGRISQCVRFDGGPMCQPCDRGYGVGWNGLTFECNARFADACQGRCNAGAPINRSAG